MSFLAPLFLFGGLAVGLPILFHLIRRTTREVTPFSSLMFLRQTPPRVTRRSRLENLWLLLLRCLVLLLLALAFARPLVTRFMDPDGGGAAPLRTIVLLDTSASMRRDGLWPQAKARAQEILRAARPGEEAAVVTFDGETRALSTLEEWRKLAREERDALIIRRVEGLEPGWGGTALGPALVAAVEMLQREPEAAKTPGRIVVLSDMQEGSSLDGLQGFEWPKLITVAFEPMPAGGKSNAGLHWMTGENAEVATAPAPVNRIRVSNSSDAVVEQFRLGAPDALPADQIDVQVPMGQSRTVRVPRGNADRVVLTGDDVPFDNVAFIAGRRTQQYTVVFAGVGDDEKPEGLLYFLRRAMQETPGRQVTLHTWDGATPLDAALRAAVNLVIVGSGLPASALPEIRGIAETGKPVLATMSTVDDAATVSALLRLTLGEVEEGAVKDYAMLAQMDLLHPLLAPFADPRYSDFSKIHFWKYRKVNAENLPEVRVLARFDSGDPALLQMALGSGSLYILTSSWRPADSQLALSSKFVPLLSSLMEQGKGAAEFRAQYFVGEQVALSATRADGVRKPDGTVTPVPAGGAFTGTDEPGLYTVLSGSERFAVNLVPEESRTAPLPLEQFVALGVPTSAAPVAESAASPGPPARVVEQEAKQKLWHWLLVGAVLFLLIEILWAARQPGRTVTTSPSPAS